MKNGFINIHEAANMLCLSVAHLYRLTSQHRVPFLKLGHRVVFDPEKLRQWAESYTVTVEK